MLRFLLTPRWLALTMACVLLLPAFKSLSDWQWRRLHQRQSWNATITANESRNPLALTQLPTTLGTSDQWQSINQCGHWDDSRTVLVRNKSFEAHAGLWVATPFTGNGVTLVIVRGWVAAGETSMVNPIVETPPAGQVCLTARMRVVQPRTTSAPSDLPAGQVDRLVPNEIVPGAYATGYGELVSSDPESAQGLRLLPAPEITEGPHRSYALQWLFFMLMVVVGWVLLVRAEVQRLSAAN